MRPQGTHPASAGKEEKKKKNLCQSHTQANEQ
jgi:hypothetical protein